MKLPFKIPSFDSLPWKLAFFTAFMMGINLPIIFGCHHYDFDWEGEIRHNIFITVAGALYAYFNVVKKKVKRLDN